MKTTVHTTPRLHRMEQECAGSAGQARALGLALAVLIAVLGLAGLLR